LIVCIYFFDVCPINDTFARAHEEERQGGEGGGGRVSLQALTLSVVLSSYMQRSVREARAEEGGCGGPT